MLPRSKNSVTATGPCPTSACGSPRKVVAELGSVQVQADRALCASSCLENTSGSHDLLALKKYFHLNCTNVSACGSRGPGSRQSRVAFPARLGLCRWLSSAGGDAEAWGARLPPSPQSGLPGARASSLLLPPQSAPACSLELWPALPIPCLICAPCSPSRPKPAGVAMGHTRSERPRSPSCGICCGVEGAPLFPPLQFWWEDGASGGDGVTAWGVTLHI